MWIVFFVSVCKPSAIASLKTGRHQLVWSDWTFYICKGSAIKLYDRTMKYNCVTSWKLLIFRCAVAKNGKVAHKPQVNEWPTRRTMLNSGVCFLKRPSHVKLMLANSCWQTQIGLCERHNTGWQTVGENRDKFYLSPTVCQRVVVSFTHTNFEFAYTSWPTLVWRVMAALNNCKYRAL